MALCDVGAKLLIHSRYHYGFAREIPSDDLCNKAKGSVTYRTGNACALPIARAKFAQCLPLTISQVTMDDSIERRTVERKARWRWVPSRARRRCRKQAGCSTRRPPRRETEVEAGSQSVTTDLDQVCTLAITQTDARHCPLQDAALLGHFDTEI